MRDRRGSALCLTTAVFVALLAGTHVLWAAETFTQVRVERPCPIPPSGPCSSGSASSTTGLSQIIGNADNLARADASFTGPFGTLRVEARTNRPVPAPTDPTNPSYGVRASSSFTDSWVTSLGVGGSVTALGVAPVVHFEGMAGPIPNGDLRFVYTLYAQAFDVDNRLLFQLVLVDLRVTVHEDGHADGEICPINSACTSLTIAGPGSSSYSTSIPLPAVSVGCSFPLSSVGPFLCTAPATFDPSVGRIDMLETASVRAEMDPDQGQSGVIDFFNTITSALQAVEPGAESAWTSDAGRPLVPAGGAPAPVASAGPDQTVAEGEAVILDGSASTGSGLTFTWLQLAGPAASLSSATSPTPGFTAPPLPGGLGGNQTLTFQLTVSNTDGSSSDTVDVTVRNVNHDPMADAGPDQTLNEGSPVTLSAANSFDPDGDPIVTYQWVQTGGPAVILDGATASQATFTAPLLPGGLGGPAVLTFELTVSDGELPGTDAVVVTIEQTNHPPTADAGADQTKSEGSPVMLDGNGSGDPDGDPLTYTWSQLSGPPVTLSNPASPTPTFTAPAVDPGGATVVLQLVVSDAAARSEPSQVRVSVLNVDDPPVCDAARPSRALLWPPNHKLVAVEILGVTFPNNAQVTISITGVTQDEPVNGQGDGDTSPDAVLQGSTALLRAERSGDGNGRIYEVHFTADDGQGGSCTGSVRVTVPANMKRGTVAIDDGQFYDATHP